MADVRLTAINPEDSQVYPVACNDKGELLLDSGGASGDLDVAGNLTVAGSSTFAGDVQVGGDAVSTPGCYFGSNGTVKAARDDANTTFVGRSTSSNSVTFSVLGNGSATFAGEIIGASGGTPGSSSSTPGVRFNTSNSANILSYGGLLRIYSADEGGVYSKINAQLNNDGSALFAGGEVTVFASGSMRTNGQFYVADQTTLSADGSARFSANVEVGNPDPSISTSEGVELYKEGLVSSNVSADGNSAVVVKRGNTVNVRIKGDGSATFVGNVTAPNINFKLAPATVAAMPAPLIDEGFAANNEVDLLSVIMEMKLQIRDLNAFMQRSSQDDPET